MIGRLAGLSSLAIALTFITPVAPADASLVCEIVKVRRIIRGEIVLVDTKICHETAPPSNDGPADVANLPPPAGSAACLGGMIDIGLDPDDYCGSETEDQALPAITGGLVATAFRRLTLPASDLVVQPPGGRTLVNFETNFLTTNDHPLTRTIQLLGRPLQLRIWPTSYTWYFDDGDTITTTTPGSRFPDLEVTHNYLSKGHYYPTVATTYSAEWRVGQGPWQPVLGTATIAGDPVQLRAIEATPTLIGYGG